MLVLSAIATATIFGLVQQVNQKNLEETIGHLVSFPTRHTLSGAVGVDRAADWIKQEFEKFGGNLKVSKQTWVQAPSARIAQPTQISNVIATLTGTTRPNEVIVISGHYDSRVTDVLDAKSAAPGANDDGSGVALVLEAARILAHTAPECTVIFAAVTGEEQGLFGAQHLAETLKQESKTVLAMATYDCVGNSLGSDGKRNNREIMLYSSAADPTESVEQLKARQRLGYEAESPARILARAIADSAATYTKGLSVTLVYRNDRFGRGGDHSAFLNAGFARAVRFTEPNENWNHQHQDLRTENGVKYGDLPEFMDFAYLAAVTKVCVAWVSELSQAPQSPDRVRIALDLSSRSTLSWAEVPGADSYEVVVRKTTEALWSRKAIKVPKGTLKTTVPLNKDHHIFGVRAVSPSGARSLPTLPTTGR